MSAVVPLQPNQYMSQHGFFSQEGGASAGHQGGQESAGSSWNGVKPPPGAITSNHGGQTVYSQRLHEDDHGMPSFRGLSDQPRPTKRIRLYEDPLRYSEPVAPGVPTTYVPPMREALRMRSRGVIHTGAFSVPPGNIRL